MYPEYYSGNNEKKSKITQLIWDKDQGSPPSNVEKHKNQTEKFVERHKMLEIGSGFFFFLAIFNGPEFLNNF